MQVRMSGLFTLWKPACVYIIMWLPFQVVGVESEEFCPCNIYDGEDFSHPYTKHPHYSVYLAPFSAQTNAASMQIIKRARGERLSHRLCARSSRERASEREEARTTCAKSLDERRGGREDGGRCSERNSLGVFLLSIEFSFSKYHKI